MRSGRMDANSILCAHKIFHRKAFRRLKLLLEQETLNKYCKLYAYMLACMRSRMCAHTKTMQDGADGTVRCG